MVDPRKHDASCAPLLQGFGSQLTRAAHLQMGHAYNEHPISYAPALNCMQMGLGIPARIAVFMEDEEEDESFGLPFAPTNCTPALCYDKATRLEAVVCTGVYADAVELLVKWCHGSCMVHTNALTNSPTASCKRLHKQLFHHRTCRSKFWGIIIAWLRWDVLQAQLELNNNSGSAGSGYRYGMAWSATVALALLRLRLKPTSVCLAMRDSLAAGSGCLCPPGTAASRCSPSRTT